MLLVVSLELEATIDDLLVVGRTELLLLETPHKPLPL